MTKLLKLLILSLLVFSYTVTQADVAAEKTAETKAEKMMNKTKDALKAGQEATSKAMNKAKQQAADAAAAAVAKLPAFTINSVKPEEPEAPSKDFKWTPDIVKLADEGDPKRGQELAKKGKCSKCHGDTGVSEDDDTPSIAGQITAYSFKQLHDYKVGLRESKEMLKRVRDLNPKDMADISAWYATQTPEKMLGGKPPVLALQGDPARHMLACNSCHNEDSMKRGYQTPTLEGQKIEYFTETMMAFKEGDRVNDHYSLMRSLAAKLTDKEIEELAAYYSAKPSDDE